MSVTWLLGSWFLSNALLINHQAGRHYNKNSDTSKYYILRHAHLIRFTTGPENSDLNIFPRLFPSLGKYGQIGRTQTRSYHE